MVKSFGPPYYTEKVWSCVNNGSEQNVSYLKKKEFVVLTEKNVQWPPPPSVYSPPENIPHSTVEAYKVLKWLVFIGANNIRCCYLRYRSEAVRLVSSPKTPFKSIFIYSICTVSHICLIFSSWIFFFWFCHLLLGSRLVRSSCGSALWDILIHIFVLHAERRNNETRHHQMSITYHLKTRLVQEHSIRPLHHQGMSFPTLCSSSLLLHVWWMCVPLPLLSPCRPVGRPSAGGWLRLSLLLG